ncbi:unnamed protein product, partial [marine sediment metagenome]
NYHLFFTRLLKEEETRFAEALCPNRQAVSA